MILLDQIILDRSPGETRLALMSGGALVELLVERGAPSRVGQIVLARVKAVRANIGAAFLDIGGEDAYLGLGADPPPAEGASLLVQIANDAWGGKRAKVNRGAALQGELIVLTPGRGGPAVSRRVAGREDQARLRALLAELLPAGVGAIARTRAAEAEEAALRAEIDTLLADWREIAGRAEAETAPAVLWSPDDLIGQARRAAPSAELIEGRDGEAFAEHAVEEQIDAALARRVALASGGNIAIDRTEAVTAIDVNAGAAARGADTIKALCFDAAETIAHQVRLRELSGLIVVDFPRLASRDDREALEAFMKALFADDPAGATVHGWTRAGLLEVTRRRRRRGLAETMIEAAGPLRRTAETVGHEALRRALRESGGRARPTILCAPEVADYLEHAGYPAFAETRRRLGGGLAVVGTAGMRREDVQIREGQMREGQADGRPV